MIEYKAYHRTNSGDRGGKRQAVRKKGKDRKGNGAAPGDRLRVAAWISALLVAVVLLGASCAFAYSWLTRSPMFSVRSIEMNPCANVTREEVWSIVRGGGKRNIWTVPVDEVSRRLASHPWIRSVSVRKAFPDRLVVRIEEHRPVAMVNLDALWYVNGDGKLFKRITAYDPKNLPIVTGFSVGDLRAKDAVTARDFRKALELAQAAEAGPLRGNLSEVHFDAQDGYTLVTRDTGVQFRVGGMDHQKAIRRVEEALPKVSGLGKSSGIVDLKTEGRIFVRPGE
ncbi:MAG: Cell division protein FtsQ [Deltaproteobacteria bacterium]|nr:Cell division protein FtsQ [Deltaproteobacteria bacterium]